MSCFRRCRFARLGSSQSHRHMDMSPARLRIGTASKAAGHGSRQTLADVETPSRAETRLRATLADARVDLLTPSYAWKPCGSGPGDMAPREDAITMARCASGWCELVPAESHDNGECWAIISMHFHGEAQVEGFVDWFASQLRSRIGPRIIVATGRGAGYCFAYWGVPEAHRNDLGRELKILASPPVTGTRGVGLL